MDLIQIGMPPQGEEPGGEGEVDPVCGMRVEPARAAGKFDYRGRTYYFCARSCLEKFRAEPERFIGAGGTKRETKHPHPGPLPEGEGGRWWAGARVASLS